MVTDKFGIVRARTNRPSPSLYVGETCDKIEAAITSQFYAFLIQNCATRDGDLVGRDIQRLPPLSMLRVLSCKT